MVKHTPGPWEVERVEDHGSNVASSKAYGISVAWCGANGLAGISGSHFITSKEAEANAKLIAAAPQLLAVAYACKGFTDEDGKINGVNVLAAIAKAEGRS